MRAICRKRSRAREADRSDAVEAHDAPTTTERLRACRAACCANRFASMAPSALPGRLRRDLRWALGCLRTYDKYAFVGSSRSAESPEQIADRVFWPSCKQRKALRRELLVQLEEKQRSDATKIGKKTMGATCEGFGSLDSLATAVELALRLFGCTRQLVDDGPGRRARVRARGHRFRGCCVFNSVAARRVRWRPAIDVAR